MASHIFGFLGWESSSHLRRVSERTGMFVLLVKSKGFFIQYKVDTEIESDYYVGIATITFAQK